LRKRCKNYAGICKKEYFKYYGDKKVVYALKINKVFLYDDKIDPYETNPDFRPPQNFFHNTPVSIPEIL
jgi:predicted transcriptional regulator